jgi:hypothetical protein
VTENVMTKDVTPTRRALTTPRAAAFAGILFSVLLIISLVLIRIAVPSNPRDAGTWLSSGAKGVGLALNLLPFAGIAFLWFIGVVRDRLGEREDRFIATVFLGSGLLFVAMLFTGAAVAGGLILAYGDNPGLIRSDTYALGRAETYQITNIYAAKMAGVFMISGSTLWLRTGVLPRWIAFLGYALALVLLLTLGLIDWISLIFPLWVLLISVYIMFEHPESQFRGPAVT